MFKADWACADGCLVGRGHTNKPAFKKYQIEVRPSAHELLYEGKTLYIPSHNKDCKWCVYGDRQCRYSRQKYKDLSCPYLKAISPLAVKLYHDNAEIEMFLLAPENEMLEYSTVKNYPEIFETLENFVKEWSSKDLGIGLNWARAKQNSCILTVCIKYNDFSYLNGNHDNGDENDIFWRYEKFCRKTYDYAEQLPACFWDNIWFINTYLDLICSFGGDKQMHLCRN